MGAHGGRPTLTAVRARTYTLVGVSRPAREAAAVIARSVISPRGEFV